MAGPVEMAYDDIIRIHPWRLLMKLSKSLLLLLITASTSFETFAEKIYKTVDESGNVVFSDQKTAGSEKVKVQPNVIDIRTPVMPEPTAEEKAKKAKQKEVTQEEQVGRGTATGGNLKRKIRNVTNGGENIKRPVNRPVNLPARGQGGVTGGGRAGGGR